MLWLTAKQQRQNDISLFSSLSITSQVPSISRYLSFATAVRNCECARACILAFFLRLGSGEVAVAGIYYGMWNSNSIYYLTLNLVQPQDFRLQNKWCLSAKKIADISTQEERGKNGAVVKKKTSRTTRRTATRTRKKATVVPAEKYELVLNTDAENEESALSSSSQDNEKTSPMAPASTPVKEQKTEKKVRRRRTKKDGAMVEQQSESEISDIEVYFNDEFG
ncbi:hypothetical protein DITRI_Ditri17bG0113800 [Diplodiscus trichospermus]